jgi:circadian clock protein KaiB
MEDLKITTGVYVLRLYITGATPNSTKAINNIKAICNQHLEGRYDLKVIDIYQEPGMAKKEQVIAVPLLVKLLPLPVKRLIGNLSDTEKVLKGLDLQ